MLSGQKLIDDRAFRDEVIALTGGEAVGGEMEAHGLVRACQSARTDWLVIKAIADFADGKKPKGKAKQRIQRDAAFRAAWVARWTIDGGVPLPLPASTAISGAPAVAEPRPRADRRVALSPAAETPDFDATRDLGVLLENPAERTTLDAQRLVEERAARQKERGGSPALELLRAWLADPAGPSYFAVLGEYGMGKTIVCQRLTRELEQARRSTPGLVPLYFDLKKVTGLRTLARRRFRRRDHGGARADARRGTARVHRARLADRDWRGEADARRHPSRRRARGTGRLRRP